MYDTGGSYSVCRPSTQDVHLAERLSWFRQELDPKVQRRRLALEEEQRRVLSMHRPLTPEQAYRLFGTLLGLFPPFAIFERILLGRNNQEFWLVLLCVGMNVVCAVVGRWCGGYLGRWAGDPRQRTRAGFALVVFVMLLGWSVVTGGLGGVLFFGIGAFFGVFCAGAVALPAFPIFAILHRLISRGGMIEERHTWPLALGIPLTIAALIMSPWLK